VQELALVALFAEASEPMFAHNASVAANVSEGARSTSLAAALGVEFANSTGGLWNKYRQTLICELDRAEGCNSLSIPVKGKGRAPNCCSRATSMSNFMPDTFATIRSMAKEIY